MSQEYSYLIDHRDKSTQKREDFCPKDQKDDAYFYRLVCLHDPPLPPPPHSVKFISIRVRWDVKNIFYILLHIQCLIA